MQTSPMDQNSLQPGSLKTVLALAIFGLSLFLLVGFAPIDSVHSITHDTRHLLGFPCH